MRVGRAQNHDGNPSLNHFFVMLRLTFGLKRNIPIEWTMKKLLIAPNDSFRITKKLTEGSGNKQIDRERKKN